MTANTKPLEGLNLLRAEFPDHQVSLLPKPMKKREEMDKLPKGICRECGGYHATSCVMHLDYVGHAAVTDRLLDADPNWAWEPLAMQDGLPKLDSTGGLWIKLTICGVTRLGYGDADGKTGGNAMKERIGDAIRNAALRFGVALSLWHKGDLHLESEGEPEEPQPKPEPRPMGWDVPSLEEFEAVKDRAYQAFKTGGLPEGFNKFNTKWQECKSNPENTPDSVLVKMEEAVKKLETAAKKKAEQDAKKKEATDLGLSA